MKKELHTLTRKCSNCERVAELHSGVKSGKFYSNLCVGCIGTLNSAEFFRRFDKQSQRREHAKEILQPDDPGYIRAYPEQAKKFYTDEEIRKAI